MKEFVITFGSRYAYDTHSALAEITDHSYMIVEAENELEAREKVYAAIGIEYAFMYPYDHEAVEMIEKYDLVEIDFPDIKEKQWSSITNAEK